MEVRSSEEEICILDMVCEEDEEEEQVKKKRRFWVHLKYDNRKQYDQFHHLIPELTKM